MLFKTGETVVVPLHKISESMGLDHSEYTVKLMAPMIPNPVCLLVEE